MNGRASTLLKKDGARSVLATIISIIFGLLVGSVLVLLVGLFDQKITLAAQNMIDRVAAFYDSYTELGRKLKSLCGEYNKGITKLQDSGQSITTSARQVISLGIRRSKGKEFTVPEEIVEIEE